MKWKWSQKMVDMPKITSDETTELDLPGLGDLEPIEAEGDGATESGAVADALLAEDVPVFVDDNWFTSTGELPFIEEPAAKGPKHLAQPWSRGRGEWDDNPLLRDVAFNKDSHNAAGGWHHVSPLANGVNHVGVDGIQVKLLRGLPPRNEIAQVMSRAMNATTGFDVKADSDVNGLSPDEIDETWQDILRGGLQGVMEAFVIVFEVSGVSRACTHQIVRSRRASFHQQSQRATRYAGVDGTGPNVRVPESVWRKMNDKSDDGLRAAWANALYWSRTAYQLACEADVSYQDARYVLPEGTENYIMCEYSLREFLAVYDYRACSMFNWEIVHVMREMGRLLVEQSPWLVGTGAEPKISCQRTRGAIDGILVSEEAGDNADANAHACTFMGWEKVEKQCGFAWARESNRTFKPSRSI